MVNLLAICFNSKKIQCWVLNVLTSLNWSSFHRVEIPLEEPLALTVFPAFFCHFFLLISRRVSPSIFVSWSRRMSTRFHEVFDCFYFFRVPQTSTVPREDFHYLLLGVVETPPFGGLVLVLLSIDISIVGWLP